MKKKIKTYVFVGVIFVLLSIFILMYQNTQKESYVETVIPQLIINLDRRPDRLKTATNLLKEYGFNPKRFSAVDSSQMSMSEIASIVDPFSMESIKNGYRSEHDQLSVGAVGCYLSHVKVWQKMVNENIEQMVIFEDDVIPKFDYSVFIQNYVSNLPKDWNILLLGGEYSQPEDSSLFVKISDIFLCLHAYMINIEGAQILLSKCFPISKQIDWYISDMLSSVNVYGVKENLWIQTHEDTDIQTEIKSEVKYMT